MNYVVRVMYQKFVGVFLLANQGHGHAVAVVTEVDLVVFK